MNDRAEIGRGSRPAPSGRLEEALREAKNALADRGDVVVEMRDAGRIRLELLAQELEPIFAGIPADDDQFDFAISSGLQPRLWIDATAHVALGRDRRSYRFVRDGRMGRIVLAESHDTKLVADQVTRYVADRIVERRRMLDGEVWHSHVIPRPLVDVQWELGGGGWAVFFAALTLVLIGAALGAVFLLAWLWERLPPSATP